MENPKKYIDVVLPFALQQTFTYHAEKQFCSDLSIGARVVVQFGKRKFYAALVMSIHDKDPGYETKSVETVLDTLPIVVPIQFEFWKWIAGYYMCSIGEVMKAALPSGLKLESKMSAMPVEGWNDFDALKADEYAALCIVKSQKQTTIEQINRLTRKNNAISIISSLIRKGAVSVDEKIAESYKVKTISHIRVRPDLADDEQLRNAFEKLKRAEKQSQLFMLLLNELSYFSSQRKVSVPRKTLIEKSRFSDSVLNGLINRGFVEQIEVESERLSMHVNELKPISQLNVHQSQALHEIHRQYIEKQVVLLHGVTASGKTEIYIKLIDEQLKAGKQVLYLLPEIALTTQITDRLKSVFGSKAGIYHSRFNDSERIETWMKVLESNDESHSNHRLILGARSALFLPFNRLGLVIVDEEHDPSFKQTDPSPRYHARDAAIVLASMHGAKVLLGSATPSFESYYNARIKKYGLVELVHRHFETKKPEIVVADLKDASKRKQMTSHFAPELVSEIENALKNNEQVILFQNRRGFSPFVQCADCGYIPQCKNCDVSLTYHKHQKNVQCHYCGFSETLKEQCPDCGSVNILTKGFGTEKIENDIRSIFPEARIDRLDMDSVKGKYAYERIVSRFEEHKTDILVGTQMITKGLDFDNVRVVGVLSADNLLNFPDFRSFERAYQLMAQVSGRAGRKKGQGKVVIQSFQPDHPVIKFVGSGDFAGFFDCFINERVQFKYPPLFRMISISVKHKYKERAQQASMQLADVLTLVFKNRVLGPEPPLVGRQNQYYIQDIRIKYEKQLAMNEVKDAIQKAIQKVKELKQNSSVVFSINVDPY